MSARRSRNGAPFFRRPAGIVAVGALIASVLTTLVVASAPYAAAAQTTAGADGDALWTPLSGQLRDTYQGHELAVNPTEYAAYTLDADAFTAALRNAPEAGQAERAVPATITLPDPDGILLTFQVTESSLYQAGLAAEYPDFKQYIGVTASGAESLALDVSPYGVHASVRGDGQSFLVDPAYIDTNARYISYRASDLPEPEQKLVEPELDSATIADIVKQGQRFGEPPNGQVSLRTYRLALLTDPTYAEYVAPGSNAGTISETESDRQVLAAKTVLMDRVNQIYTNDLAVKLIMVNGTDKLNFNTNAEAYNPNGPCGSAACFTTALISGGCAGGLLTRNRLVVGQLIGASNFDIGHIGLGINGGGIASLGVVGGSSKAQGCTGLPQPIGDFYAVDYVAHEMGHQFSGNHTFNGTQVNCSTSNRTGTAGVEPGSGSSVMAYAGICSSDDLQPHTDPYFSQRSQTEISNYLGSTLANVNEVQEFGLTNFTTNGNAFTLTYPSFTNALGATIPGGTTVAIVRGTAGAGTQPYTAAGVKAAIEAVTGATVTVTGMFNTGAPVDAGFTITYSGNLAGVDFPTPTLTATSQTAGSSISVIANDIAAGGAPTNNGTLSTFGDHAPDVTVPAGKFLPVQTPFTLTGAATDLDNDDLVYLWEQNDNGASGTTTGVGLTQQPKTNGPLFRTFGHSANVDSAGTLQTPSPGENIATSDPSRTFPDMSQILSGATNQATGLCPVPTAADTKSGVVNTALQDGPVLECYSEFLPTSAYVGTAAAGNVEPSLNFRLTARDQDPFSGGYQFADTKLRLDRNAGPLYVTSDAVAGTTLAGGSTDTVTWNVNDTDKPSLAPTVKISLSTDGGLTFPKVLAASTPNDGSFDAVLPNVSAATARIKVEAVGNYFFDVNHADFAIAPAFGADSTFANQTVQYSDPATGQVTVTSGTGDSSTISASATGLPTGLVLTPTTVSPPGVVPGTVTFQITGASAVSTGVHPVTLTFGDGVGTQEVPFTITAAPEDAAVTYTGPTLVEETSSGPTSAALTLTAQVTQAADGTPGDITTATATFTDTTTSETLCTVPVIADGSATCSYAGNLPASGRTLAVKVDVGGNFTGATTADTPVVLTADQGLVVVGPSDTTPVVQYSDAAPAGAAEITAGSHFSPSEDFTVSTTPLPAGLTYARTDSTPAGVTPGQVTYDLVGTATAAGGDYPVTVTVSDGAHPAQQVALTVTITPEDATAAYTGTATATAATGGAAAVQIPLTGTVTQAADGSLGDLTTASATFVDQTTGDVLCTDPSLDAAGSAACTMPANLPTGDAGRTYSIGIEVGDNFVGTSPPSPLVVSVDPTFPDTFITNGPANGRVLLDNKTTITMSSSKPGSTFTCRLDGVLKNCSNGTLKLPYLSQVTHRFSVVATDAAGHADASPAVTTFTVPVNDRKLLAATRGWKRGFSSTAYLKTYTSTSKKARVLKYRVNKATAIYLVATTQSGQGRVRVTLNGKVLRTISLRGAANGKTLIRVASFTSLRSGTLRIVTLNRKPVHIGGVALVTRP